MRKRSVPRGNAVGTCNLSPGTIAMSEAPSHFSISPQESDRWSAERIFGVRWAATVVERALSQLGEECEKRGRRRLSTRRSFTRRLVAREGGSLHEAR